jgi:biopolymer transport protein ExbB/TolQ
MSQSNGSQSNGSSSNPLAASIGRSPIVWGGLAAAGFYSLIFGDVLTGEMVHRYFAGHWCNWAEGILFFVGLAALILKAFDVLAQRAALRKPLLEPAPPAGQDIEDCPNLLEQLALAPPIIQGSYYARRLREALLHVWRRGSPHTLDEQLRNLSDLDAARMQASYGLVRIVLWAIPILGFLGTVIGITMAISAFSPKDFDNSIRAMTQSLNVAFDTTAIALILCIPLMFVKFYVERMEEQVLEAVDDRVDADLAGRFQQAGTASDPNVAAVRLMSERVIQASQRLAERQSELWQSTIAAAHEQWSRLSGSTGKQLEDALAASLDRVLKNFAGQIASAERAATEQNRRQWEQVQQSLTRTAEATKEQQQELTHQANVLLKVVEATGQVQRLEQELNQNLKALAGAKHFEETVTSLAAAIQLLSARLGRSGETPAVELSSPRTLGKAA